MSTGVDLGNSSVKVVSVFRGLRGLSVRGAARLQLPRGIPEADRSGTMTKVLRGALGSNGKGSGGVLGLSGREINLQISQQPKMAAHEYQNMMGYEVQEKRGPDGELYADFCTLREPDDYFPHYLAMVGVGKRSYIDDRLEIASKAGIGIREAVPNAVALFAAYKSAYETEGGTVMLLDIGAENMDMALVRGGHLIYARNISSGASMFEKNIGSTASATPEEVEWLKIKYGSLLPPSENASEKEEEVRPGIRTAAGQLSGFIQSSVNNAKKQLGDSELSIDRMYLSGGGARLRGFLEYLQSSLKFPVEAFNPFQNLDTSVVESRGGEEFQSLPTDMAIAVGLALVPLQVPESGRISLLPDTLRQKRDFRKMWGYLGFGAASLLISLLILTVLAISDRSSIKSELAKYSSALQDVNQRDSELVSMETESRASIVKLDLLSKVTTPSAVLLDVVAKIREFGDKGVVVRELRIEASSVSRNQEGEMIRRCLFDHPDLGIVVGEILEETEEDQIRFHFDFPSEESAREILGLEQDDPLLLSVEDCEGLLEWQTPDRIVVIVGDVSAQGGNRASEVLSSLKKELTQPSRGQVARIGGLQDSDRIGWRRFVLVVVSRPEYR
jgi:type IV pilus assembly protein PilM